jgi:hypothetical protein
VLNKDASDAERFYQWFKQQNPKLLQRNTETHESQALLLRLQAHHRQRWGALHAQQVAEPLVMPLAAVGVLLNIYQQAHRRNAGPHLRSTTAVASA